MEFPTFVYKKGGPFQGAGGFYDFKHVSDESEFLAAIGAGWSESLRSAMAPKSPAPEPVAIPDDAPPTRSEIEQKAKSLGLKFDGRTSDKKLLDLIEQSEKAQRVVD